MAEFCLECWKRINEETGEGKRYILSNDLDLCEGCGEFKPVVIAIREKSEGFWERLKRWWKKHGFC